MGMDGGVSSINRRKFLKYSAVAGAALLGGLSLYLVKRHQEKPIDLIPKEYEKYEIIQPGTPINGHKYSVPVRVEKLPKPSESDKKIISNLRESSGAVYRGEKIRYEYAIFPDAVDKDANGHLLYDLSQPEDVVLAYIEAIKNKDVAVIERLLDDDFKNEIKLKFGSTENFIDKVHNLTKDIRFEIKVDFEVDNRKIREEIDQSWFFKSEKERNDAYITHLGVHYASSSLDYRVGGVIEGYCGSDCPPKLIFEFFNAYRKVGNNEFKLAVSTGDIE